MVESDNLCARAKHLPSDCGRRLQQHHPRGSYVACLIVLPRGSSEECAVVFFEFARCPCQPVRSTKGIVESLEGFFLFFFFSSLPELCAIVMMVLRFSGRESIDVPEGQEHFCAVLG